MKFVKVPDNRVSEFLGDFFINSEFTFECVDITSKEGKEKFKAFEPLARECGYKDDVMICYWFTGDKVNAEYGLTGENAYPEDVTFAVIPNLHNPGLKLAVNARWFDDIVASNRIKQNGVKFGLEPDFA